MSTAELLQGLSRLGVQVWVEGERLRLRAPSGVLTEELRGQLAARKAEILALLGGNGASGEIPRLPRSRPLPVHPAQRRMWFLHRLVPGNPFYTVSLVYQLRGPLPVAALRAAVRAILERHEALRSRFVALDGEPYAVIDPPPALPLPVVDLQRLAPQAVAARARLLAAAESLRPFDPERGALVRAWLLRQAPGEHRLYLSMDHIVTDWNSMTVLLEEMAELLAGYAEGDSYPARRLPPLPAQYPDLVAWQEQHADAGRREIQLEYWRRRLEGAPDLDLPTDRPYPQVQSFRGAAREFCFSAALTAAVQELSQTAAVTPFMTLLAGFHALLGRYTGQPDIVTGSPIANRSSREAEALIGLFVNTVALRTDLRGEPSFAELVEQVKGYALDAYDYQDLPFEVLMEVLRPSRDLRRNPLLQVVFALQRQPRPVAAGPLRIVPAAVNADSRTTRFELELHLWLDEGVFRGCLFYATDLFDATTIHRLLGHYQNLLAAAGADPRRTLGSLPVLGGGERHQLLRAWSQRCQPYERDATVPRPRGPAASRGRPRRAGVRWGRGV